MGTSNLAQAVAPSDQDPDDSHPIGRSSVWTLTSARRAFRDAAGKVVFGNEEDIMCGFRRRLVLVGDTEVGVIRFEIKVKKGAVSAPKVGDEIVITEDPHSNGWVDRAVFKAGRHRRGDDDPVRGASLEEIENLLRRLDSKKQREGSPTQKAAEPLAYDPWETGDYLTAGVITPGRSDPPKGSERNSMAAAWIFGVVRGYEALAASVAADGDFGAVVEKARADKLMVNVPGQPSIRVSRAAAERVDPYLAIRQAFAGPWTLEVVDRWDGAPVAELAILIYKNHLLNETKRAAE